MYLSGFDKNLITNEHIIDTRSECLSSALCVAAKLDISLFDALSKHGFARRDAQGLDFLPLGVCTGLGPRLRFSIVRKEMRSFDFQVLRFARRDEQSLDFLPLGLCTGECARLIFPTVRKELRSFDFQVLGFARTDVQGLDFLPLGICTGVCARLKFSIVPNVLDSCV